MGAFQTQCRHRAAAAMFSPLFSAPTPSVSMVTAWCRLSDLQGAPNQLVTVPRDGDLSLSPRSPPGPWGGGVSSPLPIFDNCQGHPAPLRPCSKGPPSGSSTLQAGH